MSAKLLRRVRVTGIVQGVGFRPFVYRLANSLELTGYVKNDPSGVLIEVEGGAGVLDEFMIQLRDSAPLLAAIDRVSVLHEEPSAGRYREFEIQRSTERAPSATLISPDTATCDACVAELFDPANRRHRYAFINCTDCGPRFTIIEGIPYDRPLTTMKVFPMCPACAAEYDDPRDRRFHAQPNACASCGPTLRLVDRSGHVLASGDAAMRSTVDLLRDGRILAIKGLGGYHLVVDPTNEAAVVRLREAKRRKAKPFALLAGSLAQVAAFAQVSPEEERLLAGFERPIVLLAKASSAPFSPLVAPGVAEYGVMLPSTPIQHLLLRDEFPALVATSGNVSEEPIAYRDDEALERLSGIADFFLIHDREIRTRVDDSIVRYVPRRGTVYAIRRARGFVPRPLTWRAPLPSVLALGAELKNTVCFTRGEALFPSHHIGDLENLATYESMLETIDHLQRILEVEPDHLACDLHPGFANTRYALAQQRLPVIQVQHHHAHLAACMFENQLEAPVIGVIFDGLGYGTDGRSWGGEFLVGDYAAVERAAHLRYFPLLGGDRAAREPFRVALAFLFEIFGAELDGMGLAVVDRRSAVERSVLARMFTQQFNAPLTSSMGRLFDAVSSLLGVREVVEYEGQAAIELEQILPRAGQALAPLPYAVEVRPGPWEIDVRPALRELALRVGKDPAPELSLRFHQTLVEIVVDVCQRIRARAGVGDVVLSGGVFLNQFLLVECAERLVSAGFRAFTHSRVPTNDGGISVGQAMVASYRVRGGADA